MKVKVTKEHDLYLITVEEDGFFTATRVSVERGTQEDIDEAIKFCKKRIKMKQDKYKDLRSDNAMKILLIVYGTIISLWALSVWLIHNK